MVCLVPITSDSPSDFPVGKWEPIAIVTLCLMGLLGIQCRYTLSIFIYTRRHFAYEHTDALLSQIYPDSSPPFLIVSMSHSVVVIIYFYNMLKGIMGNL